MMVASDDLLSVLHEHLKPSSIFEKVFRLRSTVSIHTHSSKLGGIQTFLEAPSDLIPELKRSIISLLPDTSFNLVELLPTHLGSQRNTYYVKQTPIKSSFELEDNASYMEKHLGSFNDIKEKESISFSLTIRPETRNIFEKYFNINPYQAYSNNTETEPLFSVYATATISSNDSKSITNRKREIQSSFILLEKTSSNKFTLHRQLKRAYRNLVIPLNNKHSMHLTAAELNLLVPIGETASSRIDHVRKSYSRTLEAPTSMHDTSSLDLIFGKNVHHSQSTQVGLNKKERDKHIFIVGGTGSGKSTLLESMVYQDIQKGRGVAVLDPHGDLAESLISYVPKSRRNDVIYFDPSDIEHPIGINLLEIPSGLNDIEKLQEKDFITESVVSIFRKLFSENDSGGHRIEYVLRNSVQTAFQLDKPTIFSVYELLTNKKFRRETVAKLEDPYLIDFWVNEYEKAGDYQRVKMSAGVTSKIGRFLFSESARRVIGQPDSTIDFSEILNNNKILICNLSKGKLGDDTSSIFGSIILSKIQLATLRRSHIPLNKRVQFNLYADEFQNFATMSFLQLLSEARKYKLRVIMAEQSMAQQSSQQMNDIILANAGAIISFRSASPADEELLLPIYEPFIEKGDISYLPPYNFYMRILGSEPLPPFSAETELIRAKRSSTVANEVINHTRKAFSRNEAAEKENENTLELDDYEMDVPILASE
jgi:DNA helicase HerA-like ATPase